MVTKKSTLALFFLVFAFFLSAPSVHAQINSSKYAALVVNADNGTILHQRNANALRYPASLTKMMTLYLAFDAIETGKLRPNMMLRVSANAASQSPLKLGLREGQQISVRDAMMGLIIKSANDAAVVLAEAVGGSELLGILRDFPESDESSLENDATEKSVLVQVLNYAKEHIQPIHWTVFWQLAVEEKSASEVADLNGLERAHVYVIKSRVLRQLRNMFSEAQESM